MENGRASMGTWAGRAANSAERAAYQGNKYAKW